MSNNGYRPHVDWRSANLSGVNFSGVPLRNADFRAANLSGCNFSGCDMSYADFRGANVQGANFQNSILYGAKMQGVAAQQADFRNADMRQCNLGGAYTEGAMLPAALPARQPSPSEIAKRRPPRAAEHANGKTHDMEREM
jgi:uncharacterized protein YjbI with pentapeptide repeats